MIRWLDRYEVLAAGFELELELEDDVELAFDESVDVDEPPESDEPESLEEEPDSDFESVEPFDESPFELDVVALELFDEPDRASLR